MDSTRKTLINIASVSQRVVNTLIGCTGRKSVDSFQLDRIVVGSKSLLEILNRTLLKDGHVNDQLVDWFHSEEPQSCLHTLNQMEEILNRKPEYGVRNLFFKASHSAHTQDKCKEAIRLFQSCQGYFHFFFTTDVW